MNHAASTRSIDLNRLEKVRERRNGCYIFRCPTCAEQNGDKKGEHGILYPSGAFCCIAHQGDKDHNRRIWELVGDKSTLPSPSPRNYPPKPERKRPEFPPMEEGGNNDFYQLAIGRHLSVGGLRLASERGLLLFLNWKGHRAWCVTDSRRVNAQVRRLDGKQWGQE